MGEVMAEGPMPISKAISEGVIEAQFKATGETATNVSSYYGMCMKMRLSNRSDTTVTIKMEPGMYLMPDIEAQQRMLMLEDEIIVLTPNSRGEYNLVAMCTEKYDQAPGANARFTLGARAPQKVVDLAEVINENGWFGFTGQSAVWAMHHDDLPLEFIHSEDAAKQTKLRFMVQRSRELVGLPVIETRAARSRLESIRVGEVPRDASLEDIVVRKWKISINGEFRYTLAEDVVASIRIYDEVGDLRFTYSENEKLSAGQHSFRFQFNSITYDESEQFYLRIEAADGTVLKERRISTD